MILLFLLSIIVLIYIEFKRTNILLSYYNLFMLYWFMYTVGIYLSGVYINDTIKFATYLVLLAGIFFVIGYNIIPINSKNFRQQNFSITIFSPPNLISILLLVSIIAIGFFIYVVVIKIGLNEYFFTSRGHRSWIVRPYSSFMIFIDLFNYISALSLFLYLNTKHKIYILIFIIVFTTATLHAVLTVSRNNLILLWLPVIYLFHYYNYIKAKWIVVIFSIGIFIAIIWKVLLFYLLFSDNFSISIIIENIKFPREFVVWQEIAQNILRDNITLYGQSYLDAIVKLFWPFSHTDNLSLWYVQTYEPDTFAKGGGRGFSNILEAYINFNIAGVVLFFFLFGILIYLFQKKSMNSIYFFLPYTFSLAFVNRIFRSDFTSLTKTWWWMYFISFILLFLLFKEKK
ncbi:MAG: oligosaccharide repeat unit polymerase [Sulfurovaceae bacterium]|nr:oligosaccharide repeat unit polymerase [Sulfurovaceae bacterium]